MSWKIITEMIYIKIVQTADGAIQIVITRAKMTMLIKDPKTGMTDKTI